MLKVHPKIKTRLFWMLFSAIPLLLMMSWVTLDNTTVLNITPSYPYGIWKIEKIPPMDEIKGQYVLFCPPDNEILQFMKKKGAVHNGRCAGGYSRFIKKAVGIPGDVIYQKSGIYINGVLLPNSISQNIRGITLAHIGKCFVLQRNQIWVMSDYNRLSFDSRYFGPIDIGSVMGSARPWLIWDVAERRQAYEQL